MKYYVNEDKYGYVWYKDPEMNVLHRENGPALADSDGHKAWYINGTLHREDGPAIEHSNGGNFWYLNGYSCTEEEFNEKMNLVVELTVADIEKLVGKKVKIVK